MIDLSDIDILPSDQQANGQVKQERTGWRDEGLSRRHRFWGVDCPAVDLDFVLIEYNHGKAVAVIEYKHKSARLQYSSQANYRALVDLAGDRPVFVVRYSDNFSWFRVIPLNGAAKEQLANNTEMTEKEYVTFLHKLRGAKLPSGLFCKEKLIINEV